jgi:hypothetical protein
MNDMFLGHLEQNTTNMRTLKIVDRDRICVQSAAVLPVHINLYPRDRGDPRGLEPPTPQINYCLFSTFGWYKQISV